MIKTTKTILEQRRVPKLNYEYSNYQYSHNDNNRVQAQRVEWRDSGPAISQLQFSISDRVHSRRQVLWVYCDQGRS